MINKNQTQDSRILHGRQLVWGPKSVYLLHRCHSKIHMFADHLLKLVALQRQGVLAGCDLTVLRSTIRTPQMQQRYLETGKSWTTDSRHLQRPSMAVDIGILLPDGSVTWEPKYYIALGPLGLKLAKNLDIPIVWGGRFKRKDFVHWQLDKIAFPNIT